MLITMKMALYVYKWIKKYMARFAIARLAAGRCVCAYVRARARVW